VVVMFVRKSDAQKISALEHAREVIASELAEMRRKLSVLEGRVGDLESENKALRSRVAMLDEEISPILNPRVCA
jgi:predicted  nucleic acid-binding Zn-ribbon protein